MKQSNTIFWLYITLSLLIVIAIDIFSPSSIILTSLYTIPIFIAAYVFKTKEIVLVSLITIILSSTIALIEHFSFINVCFYDFGLVIFTILAIQFSRQRVKIENTVQHMQLFIHMITHDIAQPITTIKLYLELLEKDQNKKVVQSAKSMSQAMLYLQSLIMDTKNLVQVSSGKFSIQKEPMDLAKLLIVITQDHQRTTRKHAIHLYTPKKLRGKWDKERLTQVLNNLLANAIKYSSKGEIRVQARKKGKTVFCFVKDNGIGIPSDQLPYVFDPYVRLQKKKKVSGSGLGLYISKMIIEQHLGKMWVESKEGRGSTFYFTLPV